MDAFDAAGLLLSVAGVALSLWALFKADCAKKAVDKVIVKNIDQISRDDARGLLDKLAGARDAAMGRRRGASSASSAGRYLPSDIRALEVAQDALAIVTIGADQPLICKMRVAADELKTALEAIATNAHRDGWADALGVLQGVTPEVEAIQRSLGAKFLRLD